MAHVGGGYDGVDPREKIDYMFKVVMIGDSGVGKSQLLSRFSRNEFTLDAISTIGVEFEARTLVIEEKNVKAQVWDTAGQERYKAVTTAYYRGAVGAMLVYDITKRGSFKNIPRWLKQLHYHAENDVFIILIGNKSDLRNRRQVRKLEAIELAQEEGLFFMETSALTANNVEAAFLQLITEIFNSKTKKKLVADETQENSNPASLRGKIINPAQEIPAKTNMCCTQ